MKRAFLKSVVLFAAVPSHSFHLSQRWRRRILRGYELTLCGMLVALGFAAAWPA
ncbi:hypothetical protein HK414_03745 [Ramlibacter terrae]|uniref:Uncharacterized protein n=1 Tax=Ramlibacter terrae TaxID=2732511 RepID=A0ABX6P0J7_9BURK|nr:hypothetical protein HK414_03745 [Ramlibacter terrae]